MGLSYSNICLKLGEFREHPFGTILSQAAAMRKVQRLERKLVGSSDSKRPASLVDEDIVSSCRQLQAAQKSGLEITNPTEDKCAAVFGDYLTYPDQWKEIFTSHVSNKAVEYEVEMRLLPMAQLKADGGPIIYGDMAQQWTTSYFHQNFGIGLILGPLAAQVANDNRVNSGNLLVA